MFRRLSWLVGRLCLASLLGPSLATAQTDAAAAEADGPRLEVALLVAPIPTAEGPTDLTVITEVGGPGLLEGLDGYRLDGSIELVLEAATGAEIARIDQPFALTLADRREDLRASGLRYFARFPGLAPGSYRLQAKVGSESTAATGEAATAVAIPSSTAPLLWPPMVPSANPRWLSYAQSVGAGAETASPYPFVAVDGGQYVPSAAGRVLAGRENAIEVVLWRAGEGPFELAAEVVDPEGQVLAAEPVDWQPSSPPPGDAASIEPRTAPKRQWRGRLDLSSLRPGETYTLRLRIRSAGDREVVAATPLRVSEQGVSEQGSFTATTSTDAATGAEPATEDREDLEPAADADSERLVGRALELLAEGDREQAVSTLEQAQRSNRETVRRQRASFLQASRRLARRDVESLVPIVLLLDRLAERHRQSGDVWLVAQAVSIERHVARQYAERIGPARAATEGADLLAAIGDLHGALELEPDHPLALLRLALRAERRADWEGARVLLDRLAAIRPDDEEVLLRLALNQRRLGEVDSATVLLRQLLGWERLEERVAILAYQELAASLASADHQSSAIALLERGTKLFPQSQRLRLHLGFFYERANRRRDADRLLNRIEPPTPPVLATPRSWYAQGPADEIEAARRGLESKALERLQNLREAIVVVAGRS